MGNLQRQKGGILSVIIYHEPSPACSVTRTPTQAPALCSPPRSQKGQLNPRQVLFISCSNSTVAPMLLRTSPSLLRPVRDYTGTPQLHFSAIPSIPLLQTHRSPCYLRKRKCTPLPQCIFTCSSSSCLRDHVLDICEALNCTNPQKVENECPLEMRSHQPQGGQRAGSDELCGHRGWA